MKKILSIAVALALIGAPVLAQRSNCAPRDLVVERLQDRYSEGVHARGLAQNGQAIVEVWGSAESGTWSITVTNTDGITCLVASGQSFQTMVPEVEPTAEGDPT